MLEGEPPRRKQIGSGGAGDFQNQVAARAQRGMTARQSGGRIIEMLQNMTGEYQVEIFLAGERGFLAAQIDGNGKYVGGLGYRGGRGIAAADLPARPAELMQHRA